MKWTYEALRLLLLDYETGFTVDQIACDIGLSKNRVYALLKKARAIYKWQPKPQSLDNLSAFCRIRLKRAGLDTPEKIQCAIDNGDIMKVIPFQSSIDEVKTWLRSLKP